MGLSYEDAEEIVNDVFHTTFIKEDWEELTTRKNLLAFMLDIVTKKAIDRWKANSAQKRNSGKPLTEFNESIHAITCN